MHIFWGVVLWFAACGRTGQGLGKTALYAGVGRYDWDEQHADGAHRDSDMDWLAGWDRQTGWWGGLACAAGLKKDGSPSLSPAFLPPSSALYPHALTQQCVGRRPLPGQARNTFLGKTTRTFTVQAVVTHACQHAMRTAFSSHCQTNHFFIVQAWPSHRLHVLPLAHSCQLGTHGDRQTSPTFLEAGAGREHKQEQNWLPCPSSLSPCSGTFCILPMKAGTDRQTLPAGQNMPSHPVGTDTQHGGWQHEKQTLVCMPVS